MKIIKEACIDSLEQAKYFIQKNVDRFETCSSLDKGGLTPDISLFNYIKNNSNIEQVVMLRTNEFFNISDKEMEVLISQINIFKKNGAKSFIFGFIDEKNELDTKNIDRLIEELKDCEYNFHMAIDVLGNYEKNIPILIEKGFTRILLKGGQGPAINNISSLKNIVKKFSDKIEILIGGSVTRDNFEDICKLTKANQVHGTKIL
ncbi:MAG: copper homeostasis protein CutC [Metamycoplasmataceae bacterium]